MSPVGQGLLVLLRRADAIFDAVIALAETLEAACQHPRYMLRWAQKSTTPCTNSPQQC